MNLATRALHTLAFTLFATGAFAQWPSAAVPLDWCHQPPVGITPSQLETIDRSFKRGDWSPMADTLAPLFKAWKIRSNPPQQSDHSCRSIAELKLPVVVSWVSTDAFGTDRLNSILWVHGRGRPFGAWLPGLKSTQPEPTLLEVVLHDPKVMGFAALYSSKATSSGQPDEFLKLAAATVGPFISGLAALDGPMGLKPSSVPVQTVGTKTTADDKATPVQVFGVSLPEANAEITVKRQVTARLTESHVRAKAGQLLASALMVEAAGDACLVNAATVASSAIVGAIHQHTACDESLDECRTAASNALEAALGGLSCSAAVPSRMLQTANKFRSFVATLEPPTLKAEATIRNEGPIRFSVGSLTAYVQSSKLSQPRVKVGSAGTLVDDPMPRTMTAVIVNWSIPGFDPKERSTSTSQRFRPFVGMSLLPNIGLVAGGSALVGRGFAVNAGVARLWYPTGTIGQKPGTERATLDTWFLGASFNLK